MAPALKAEFKKLLTVRTTWGIPLSYFLILGFIAYYAVGYKVQGSDLSNNLFLAGTISVLAGGIAQAGGFVSLLLLAHEYRYNTMIYTLSATNSRSKVLLSKFGASMTFVLFCSLFMFAACIALILAGVAASGHHLPYQNFSYLTYFGKVLFYCEAYALAAILLVALIRNQIGAIVILLVSGTIETLLSLLLKKNSVYLPFTALSQVIQAPTGSGQTTRRLVDSGHLSPLKGAIIFLIYLIVGWIVAWYLFLKRDSS